MSKMTKEQRDEMALRLMEDLKLGNDPWNLFTIKEALLRVYHSGVQDGIEKLADAQKAFKDNL